MKVTMKTQYNQNDSKKLIYFVRPCTVALHRNVFGVIGLYWLCKVFQTKLFSRFFLYSLGRHTSRLLTDEFEHGSNAYGEFRLRNGSPYNASTFISFHEGGVRCIGS